MIYFLTYVFLNRYYRYIAKYLHDMKGYTVNSQFFTFLSQDPGRKQNLPPEGSLWTYKGFFITSETLMKGPLTEMRAGPKEDKGCGRPRDSQSWRRKRCEWSPLRAEASCGQMQLFHTRYQSGERAWKRSLSLSLPFLRSPAGTSHWPNPRGSQPLREMGWWRLWRTDSL